MSCAEIVPKLELMADDELTSEQAAQVLSHIDDCASCRDNWYDILALRQAIKDRATSFNPSAEFEDRVIESIRKEAWQSRGGRRKNSWFLYAAALVTAGAATTYLYLSMPMLQSSKQPKQLATANKSQTADGNPPQQLAQAPPGTNTAASLEDAISNFKQYLQKTGAPLASASSRDDFTKLSKQAGFAVKPMQLSGFRLEDASLVATSPGKASMVRLCYHRVNGHGHDSIVCYQAAAGNLVAQGLAEHLIDGKRICCGEVEDKSVVFIPGQKENSNEMLLVGTVSKSDLMDLVLSSS